jgi:hypothetical protein
VTANGEPTSYRADGWPDCPRCGNDELWSKVMMAWDGTGERPTMAACYDRSFACYACRWSGYVLGPPAHVQKEVQGG